MRRLSYVLASVMIRKVHIDAPNGIERVRGETSTDGNTPAEQEGSEERTLESTNEDDGLCNMPSEIYL